MGPLYCSMQGSHNHLINISPPYIWKSPQAVVPPLLSKKLGPADTVGQRDYLSIFWIQLSSTSIFFARSESLCLDHLVCDNYKINCELAQANCILLAIANPYPANVFYPQK